MLAGGWTRGLGCHRLRRRFLPLDSLLILAVLVGAIVVVIAVSLVALVDIAVALSPVVSIARGRLSQSVGDTGGAFVHGEQLGDDIGLDKVGGRLVLVREPVSEE
jgi:hypothetical protein